MIPFDTETALFRPGLQAPPLVCVQHAGGVTHVKQAEPLLRGWLTGQETLVGHNVAYDAGVCMNQFPEHTPLWFDKYDRNQVTDTMLRQQLVDIKGGKFGMGGYGLAALMARHHGIALDKDVWRTQYGSFLDVPVEGWPQGAIQYCEDDVMATKAVYEAQPAEVEDEFRQTRYAFGLWLTRTWGVRTHPDRVQALAERVEKERELVFRDLVDAGLLRRSGVKHTKNIKEAVSKAYPGGPPLTDKENVSIAFDTCIASGDETLRKFAHWSKLGSVINKDIPMLMSGTVYPIHTTYGMAETGRTVSFKPNCQNFGRKGGIRDCFMPREGNFFFSADYAALELRTLATVCLELFHESSLARELNDGLDPHCTLGAQMMGISYDEFVRKINAKDERAGEFRQAAKVGNFGLPGGAGADTLVLFAAKNYGVFLTLRQAEDLKDNWFAVRPEMRKYFKWVSSREVAPGLYDMPSLRSGRRRLAGGFCEAANHGFQALGADTAKLAHYLVNRECYARPNSDLFGSRTVLFVHDEIVGESPIAQAYKAGARLSAVMVEAAKKLMPDVPHEAKPKVSDVYTK